MDLKDRIGIDVGRKLSVEDAVQWAAGNGVSYIDCQIDIAPNALDSFDAARSARIRDACAAKGIHLGLHTLSAVNVAEWSPFVGDAVDAYLGAYVDAAVRLGAEWIVVHAGYHFNDDKDGRMEVALERLKRIDAYAEEKGAKLLLENLNWEPERAEVHYLAHSIEECRYFFEGIDSAALGWAFTVNHATLLPEGIAGFLEALPTDRLGEVRIADSNGEFEAHLYPGDGIIDFADMHRRVQAAGFGGHYMADFGTLDDMLGGREVLAAEMSKGMG